MLLIKLNFLIRFAYKRSNLRQEECLLFQLLYISIEGNIRCLALGS